jgi:hypothetical protein
LSDSILPLTGEAFEEIKAKLEVLGLADSRIVKEDGIETLILDKIGLTKEDNRDIRCYMVFNGSIIRRPNKEISNDA